MSNLQQSDFTIFKDRKKVKVFTYTQNGVALDLTGSTLTLVFSNDGFVSETTLANGVISGTGNNVVTFTFETANTGVLGSHAYKVINTPVDTTLAEPLSAGDFRVVDENNYTTSLQEMIDTETPEGITIDEDYRNMKIFYWREYLKDIVDPIITVSNVESNWPPLVNFLIAKLVIYDFLNLVARKAYIGLFGNNDPTSDGVPVKKITTGPTDTEWFDGAASLEKLFKSGPDGKSAFDNMANELCMLAKRLRIYLPICGQLSKNPVIPQKAIKPCPTDAITILNKNFG